MTEQDQNQTQGPFNQEAPESQAPGPNPHGTIAPEPEPNLSSGPSTAATATGVVTGGLETLDPREEILQFFKYEHLKPEYQEFSRPFADIAGFLVQNTPRTDERREALRKLLEAKDCAVRARLIKKPPVLHASDNPTPGRIVNYWESVHGEFRHFPAMIQRVWNPLCLNLLVGTDNGWELRTSVQRVDPPEHPDLPRPQTDFERRWEWLRY